jgi:hypothetical protein
MPPHAHGLPGVLRPARDAIPSIVEIKDFLDGESKREGGAILAGLEHLDERYLRAVGYATKSKRNAFPKMVLIGDIVGDDEDAVARATSEVIRMANGKAAKASSPSARGAQEVLARPLAHRRHRAPHQRLQDQRRRGDPAAAHGRVHRRHRAHQHRAVDQEQAQADRRARGVLRARQPAAGPSDDANEIPSAELLEDRVQHALTLLREIRARWRYLQDHLDTPLAARAPR